MCDTNNPTLYDPLTNITNTYKRRNRILKNMLDDGKISKTAYENALGEVMALDRPEALAKMIMWRPIPIIVQPGH